MAAPALRLAQGTVSVTKTAADALTWTKGMLLAAAGVKVTAKIGDAPQHQKPPPDSTTPPQATDSSPAISDGQRHRISEVLERINSNSAHPFRQDGQVYMNKGPGHLPERPQNYYKEFTVPSNAGRRGTERLVVGANGEVFFSPDHYATFIRIR